MNRMLEKASVSAYVLEAVQFSVNKVAYGLPIKHNQRCGLIEQCFDIQYDE